jgi:beta-glucosidase
VEGIFIGYRWYNYKHIRPLFPFGYGLSYTHFAFGHLAIISSGTGHKRTATVAVRVRNTGHRAGAEVVQLYIHPPQGGPIRRVVQKLEGFQRVMLNPGQSKTVYFKLRWHAFATYVAAQHQWTVPPGAYGIGVGGSSADEPVSGIVNW